MLLGLCFWPFGLLGCSVTVQENSPNMSYHIKSVEGADMGKITRLIAAFLSLLIGSSAVLADVEVTFSDYLVGKMDRINAIDGQREAVFREFRTEGTRTAIPSNARLNRSRFAGTEWANERLFPELEDYNLPALIKAMMERGIKEADPAFDGTVQVKIDKLRIQFFSLAALRGPNTQMSGDVEVLDAAGNVVKQNHIWAAIVPRYTAARGYDGPDYAYRTAALNTRVGPIAAEFTEKALRTLYPDYDAPGVVVVDR